MLQTLIQRYENGCLMLMDVREGAYVFLGSAFIAHEQGYLLTASHLFASAQSPVVVWPSQPGVFSALTSENVAVLPVEKVRDDPPHDITLLKAAFGTGLDVPDDFLGNPESLEEGSDLLAFGVSFGHFRIHNVIVVRAMLSAKLISPNQSNLLLFDASVHPGDVGGPLVNACDGRIVGIIQGGFNPLDIQQIEGPPDYHLPSAISYAISIEYAQPLLEQAGLVRERLY